MSLRTGVMWTGFGNGVYLACQYATLMVLAKLGNPALVGQFSLGLAITAPVIILSQMQLRQMQVTDVKRQYLFADYFCSRLIFSALALIVIGGVVAFSGYSAPIGTVIVLIGLAKVFESLSDVAFGKIQRHERMDLIAISLVIKGLGSLLAFGLALWLTGSLIWSVAAMSVVWAGLFFCYDLPMANRVSVDREPALLWRLPMLKRLTVLAMPLAFASGLTSILGNMPRYFLQGYQGEKAVAMFSVAAAPLALVTLLCAAISQASTARAAAYFQAGHMMSFRKLAAKVAALQLLIGVVFTAVFAVSGEWLIATLFTREYISAAPVLVIISAGTAVGNLAAFGSMVLTAGRMFKQQLLFVLLVFVLQIPIAWLFVARLGVIGAGWSDAVKNTVAMVAINALALGTYLRRHRQNAAPLKEKMC